MWPLAHLFIYICIIPISNAIVEREFSKTGLVKTDLRNSPKTQRWERPERNRSETERGEPQERGKQEAREETHLIYKIKFTPDQFFSRATLLLALYDYYYQLCKVQWKIKVFLPLKFIYNDLL